MESLKERPITKQDIGKIITYSKDKHDYKIVYVGLGAKGFRAERVLDKHAGLCMPCNSSELFWKETIILDQPIEFIKVDIIIDNPKCECGAEKLGHLRHSDWCPKYEECK